MPHPAPPVVTSLPARLHRLLRLGTDRVQAALLLLALALAGGLVLPGAAPEGDRGSGGTSASAPRAAVPSPAMVETASVPTAEPAGLGDAPPPVLRPAMLAVVNTVPTGTSFIAGTTPPIPPPPRGPRQPTGPPATLS